METKKIPTETFLEEELREIDLSVVDDYPSFDACDSLYENVARENCFENRLVSHFYGIFATKNMVVEKALLDTIWIELAISEKGVPLIKNLKISDSVRTAIPKMEGWIYGGLDSLPKINPAIKRGIPVRTSFTIPVVIEVN
ncbi:MAG: hypothetical protein WBG71_04835 [Leeuwenhoekiella sp.]